MVKVSTLKEQARALEQQGETAKALAIYQHVIKYLEGTPDIKRQLALYVKAGDLLLSLEDPKSAIEMYERAGEQYAESGSAQSVIVVCGRILGAAPEAMGVHLRFARQMVERGLIARARHVLVDYAERGNLDKTLAALEQLAGRSDDEVRPALEMLLELAVGRAAPGAPSVSPQVEQLEREAEEAAPVQGPAEPPVPERAALPPVPQEPTTPPESAEQAKPAPAAPPLGERDTQEPGTALSAEQVAGPPAEATEAKVEEEAAQVEPEAAPTAAQVGEGAPETVAEPEPAPEPAEAPSAVAPGRPLPEAAPREPSRKAAVRVEPVVERKRSRRVWVDLGALVIVVVAVAGLVRSGVIRIDDLPFVGREPPDQATSPVAPLAQDSAAAAAGDTGISAEGAGDTTGLEADTAARGTPPAAAPAPLSDTIARVSAQGEAPPVATPPAAAPAVIVAVQGLDVESVTDVSADGTIEYRIVQRLESGERLTLTLVFVGADSAGVPATGEIQVTSLPGDTAVGRTRFGDYLVNARGRISADTLEALLRRLVEQRPSN